MKLSRRMILLGAGSLPFASASLGTGAIAQTISAAPGNEVPPILFVHGNGDYDALWMTTLWRMESNGVARERMAAINFTDPNARTDDKVEQANRSSTEDQRRELTAAIAELKRRTGAARVALVGSSRGGYAIRNVIKNGGAGDVSHAVLCGTPNHGVFATDDQPNSEFNGRGAFLRALNEGESEVTPGVAFLTLRSDGMDKYAQADGRFIGKPGTPTGVTNEGPELKGATNLVLGALDHREVAFHPRAFREIYKFIAGREPARIAIVPEPVVRLSGLVTGTPGGVPTNRPVAGATVDIFRVDPDTGERKSGAVHSATTGADGRWGPAQVEPSWPLEFVLTSPGAPITHIYRSPFPRSSDVVHLRAARPLGPADKDAGAVVIMSRPRGYFGRPRDVVLLDGKEPADVKPGVPTDSAATLRLAAGEVGRNIVAQFGEERIVARAWAAQENRIAIVELTY
ncbi:MULTISPECIES: hydrolase [unclassified Bradyrhizobium]|uniref:hydrolase n=1 Tax=unclassified Bradyrhizobium TaxID=2631580 RepID=UPI00211E866B|nr:MULTISPECIES: hydrolase [unclassified Bradyrhizobium]MDD1531903.1 hydrolase [Bradyrhizobium sp. WBOS8]MDD1584943.1 hydrolase [Bradyrhizobium sp. WBOS4]UUO46218.1 hydrolase [Bradyrhizobium sp. WBOS04]UUO60179.1 hydrolase [Bradyrhizobium sp. WBOS08]